MVRRIWWLTVVSLLVIWSLLPSAHLGAAASGKLEIFSWWTAGGEAEGLAGMFSAYKKAYPGVEIVNATVAGGAGTNAKAVLATRLTGGDPPDSFQVHAGLEVQKYAPAQYLEPLSGLFKSEGWEKAFPAGLLTLLRYQDNYWSVPVNIHRANVMWYSKKVFTSNNLTPPKSFDEFFKVADALKAKGIVPFVLGDKEGWESGHAFEAVLIGTLGADGYRGLWTGQTPWTDAKVTQALNTYKRMLTYTNSDHAALTWDGAGQYILDNKGAMEIMGDWENGWFQSKNYTDYGWAPPPGNAGVFDALSDSFAMPKAAKNRVNALNWLKVSGSKAGQEAFNPKKGSICARTDCNQMLFNAYLQSAAKDWAKDALVPSVIHGAASIESWAAQYKDIMALFVTSGNVANTQTALQTACKTAGVCK
jgi:glucose/mannose transport system substrate-binding protein